MKTSELKNKLEDMGLTVKSFGDGSTIGAYDVNKLVADVSVNTGGQICTYRNSLYLSQSDQRQMVGYLMDYAQTPVRYRRDEKRWNVVIGRDSALPGMTIYRVTDDGYETAFIADESSLKLEHNVLTDSQFDGLISFLIKQRNGDTYAKIAELGKQVAKS